jgi:hypothetical protein
MAALSGPTDWCYKAFLTTADGDEAEAFTLEFPKRWPVEEFFNANQALGWNGSGTQNLNIGYGQMTLTLAAQAAIYQLRRRLGDPVLPDRRASFDFAWGSAPGSGGDLGWGCELRAGGELGCELGSGRKPDSGRETGSGGDPDGEPSADFSFASGCWTVRLSE